ncbi:polyprenol monophosphomannose synthase [Prosthecochloris sp. SCSIO W1101]|uniref:polyprenol monophosphomannose synthase n=1 Tax=Prosthecochloris sp. SCSIO W1101 TaxID=2992242 RepID=UPI00223D21F6|nr:polyprenol monophosphomannose synthase [Prosthecochloris sp. SCSIO W1101]UZJ41208.1 polyprenol monophosphomannose synthase [Prosthecochloris sp. SCSIO W1101]
MIESRVPTGKTLVIIPTYNESENIGELLDDIFSRYPEMLDILIIDDNSPDGTAGLIKEKQLRNKRLYLKERPGKMGLGTAYIDGFRYALEHDYCRVIEMDADYSHDPEVIGVMLEKSLTTDLVIGSRYINNTVNVINWPLGRLVLSKMASIYTRLITGMPVSDPTSGYKCFQTRVLKEIDLDKVKSQGYSFQIEMNFKVWKKGFTIDEVPIIFIDRAVGKSKMTKRNIVEAVWVVWWLPILSFFRRL